MCIYGSSNRLFLLECKFHFTKIIINSGTDPECFLQKDDFCLFKTIGRVYVPQAEITWENEKPDDANEWIKKLNLENPVEERVLLRNKKLKKIIGKYLGMKIDLDVVLPQHLLE